jgi:hypothetical protein
VHPSEKSTFTDPTTGAAITQYTRVGAINRTLYFTNRSWVCDGEHIVFLSDRTGRNEMFLLHRRSGRITQVTDAAGQGNVANCLHPTRPELYFRTESTISRVRLDTLKTEDLLRAPDGFRVGMLDLKGAPWLAFELIEILPQGVTRLRHHPAGSPPPPPGPPGSQELVYRRPLSMICRYHVDDDHFEILWSDHRLLTHVQCSPTNSNLVIFSDCAAYGADRCYWLDASRKVKNVPQPTFPEGPRARAGHEAFTRRGTLYAQWMQGDLERFGQHTLHHVFLHIGDLPLDQLAQRRSERFRQYQLPETGPDLAHHFTMSSDERWGVHDRWLTAPDWRQNMSWLSIFRHQPQHPQTLVEPICFHNGMDGDRKVLGAELAIDDHDELGLYSSFLGGTTNVCEVDLRPFVDRIMKGV